MCGIAGYSFKKGRIPNGQLSIIGAKLAQLNDDRGGHSWGTVRISRKGNVVVDKGLGDLGASLWAIADTRTLMIHTRWATTGAKTVANAHPFQVGNILGAHNGMIYNHDELLTKYNRAYEVDSAHLFANLAEDKDFSDLEGYGSIEWIDRTQTNKINLAQLLNGELSVYYVGDVKDPDGVVWSSDENHVIEALSCAGIANAGGYDIKIGHVYQVINGTLYTTGKELHLKKSETYVRWQDIGMDLTSDDGPTSKEEKEYKDAINIWDKWESMRDYEGQDYWPDNKIHRRKMS